MTDWQYLNMEYGCLEKITAKAKGNLRLIYRGFKATLLARGHVFDESGQFYL